MSGAKGNTEILIRDRRNGQWAWVNNAVLADPHLTPAEKIVYSALATFDGCEVIRPSIPTIAKRSSLGVRTVRMALGKLKQVGYISVEVQKNGSGPSIYTLLKAANGCDLCRDPGKICPPAKSAPVQKGAGDPGKRMLQTPAKSAAEIDNELDKIQISTSANHPEPNGIPANGHKWPSPELLIRMYNELTPDECPAVEKISTARKSKANNALKQFPERESWEQIFRNMHHSDLLRGKKPNPGHEHFIADFDWLLSKGKNDQVENYVKVYEGKYS